MEGNDKLAQALLKVMRTQISLFQRTHLYLSSLISETLPELNTITKSICATIYFFYSKFLIDFSTAFT